MSKKWKIENWTAITAVYLMWATEKVKDAKGELKMLCDNIIAYIGYGADAEATDDDRKRYFQNNISKAGRHLDDWPNPSDKLAKLSASARIQFDNFMVMRKAYHTKVFNLKVKNPLSDKMVALTYAFDVRVTKGDNKQTYHHDLDSYLETKLDSDKKSLLKRYEENEWSGTFANLFKSRKKVESND